MSIFSTYLHQAQLKPQYHPSYSAEPKGEAGRPVSKLRLQRKQRLLEISLEIGTAVLADILAINHQDDPRLHKDDCRKMLDEMVRERLMDKKTTYVGGKKVFYTARPE